MVGPLLVALHPDVLDPAGSIGLGPQQVRVEVTPLEIRIGHIGALGLDVGRLLVHTPFPVDVALSEP